MNNLTETMNHLTAVYFVVDRNGRDWKLEFYRGYGEYCRLTHAYRTKYSTASNLYQRLKDRGMKTWLSKPNTYIAYK